MAKFDITAAFQAAVGTAGNVSKLDTWHAMSASVIPMRCMAR